MTTGFLLRFAESTHLATSEALSTNNPATDGVDEGAGRLAVPLAATKTVTEVKREQPDADPCSQSYHPFPR